MRIREITEHMEETALSEFAVKSSMTKGRAVPESKCEIRTEFQRDRDRITHCKAFRRLMHKTQVFISPEGDHYRTRLTHTLEVAQISRTIARALRLNEDLAEAIALGHDLGHTPFGHTGEEALDKILPEGFRHNEQSLRVVSLLERDGRGLNLTAEVLDGIFNHRGEGHPNTLEGKIVQLSDKIAYINHDIDDAERAGVLKRSELPRKCVEELGDTAGKRIDALIKSVVYSSLETGDVVMAPDTRKSMNELRQYMFKTVYFSQLQIKEREKIYHMFEELYGYFLANPSKMPEEFVNLISAGQECSRVVCDYIACMTDRFAIRLYSNLFMPVSWNI